MNGLIDWNVRPVVVRDEGLVGTLFVPPSSPPHPVVITVGGSGPGVFSAPGALLASRGIAVLALAYFGVEHLPPNLKRIPLEYFEIAIQWCRCRKDLRQEAIAIAGASHGGELALLDAIGPPHPYIRRSPTHFVHPVLGYDFECGGSPELNASASEESWERAVAFFQRRFASLSKSLIP